MGLFELLEQYGDKYWDALVTTWQLTFVSFLGAFILGLFVTVARVCPLKPLRLLGDFYVQVFRNVPGAALLMVVTYALPRVVDLSFIPTAVKFNTFVIMVTVLIAAAFVSENLMSGINTVSVGQIEAARSLGLTFGQTLSKVVVPQAIRAAILPLTNLLILVMLTTSLASLLPRPMDLTSIVSYINSRSVGGILAFAISAAGYLVTALVIARVGNFIDKKVRVVK